MSLTPKIDEVRVLISQHSFDFLFITETWLRNTIGDNHIFLADYNLIRRDHTSGQHGGVCFYTRNHIKCRRLDELEDPNFEVLWAHTRPPRLPRRVPCVIAACVYHPPSSNNSLILEYLSEALTKVEGLFPGCAIVIAGDFNQLDIKLLMYNFQLKQLVNRPTCSSNILDLVLTNMHKYYEPSSVKILPPFGLSDHNTITISPKQRTSELSSQRTVLKRDTRPSRKAELGGYLSKINWNTLENAESCEEKNELFSKIISTGVDIIMPERTIKLHSNDAPWVTEDFKRLISLRKRAFSSGKLILFKFYRNKVNRTRNFFTSTFNQLKLSKPKTW